MFLQALIIAIKILFSPACNHLSTEENGEYFMKNKNDSDHDRYSEDENNKRIATRMTATLYRQNGEGIPVFVENLSTYGVKVESNLKIEIGEAITLSIEGLGDFDGVVRWIRQNHFGVHTIDSININLLSDQN